MADSGATDRYSGSELQELLTQMSMVKFLGLRFLKIEPRAVDIEMPYRHEVSLVPGEFHAGPLGTLVEIASGVATATLLPRGWANAAVDVSLKLFAPATGSTLIARASALSAGRTLSVGEAKVWVVRDAVETLCASGMVTLRNFPAGT